MGCNYHGRTIGKIKNWYDSNQFAILKSESFIENWELRERKLSHLGKLRKTSNIE